MPYSELRGVMIYQDHDTPPEYATSADEDRAIYNEARDEAFEEAGGIQIMLDEAYDEYACSGAEMRALADKIAALRDEIKRLLRGV